ncbi:MAG TPA: hypothetical protein PKD37_05705 [Oligoflexia bacterium]|nr:hypothetical protein [Oligoflexia bacterium]HMP27459.1 hypothetical protein [Oligoflexia bacterium]
MGITKLKELLQTIPDPNQAPNHLAHAESIKTANQELLSFADIALREENFEEKVSKVLENNGNRTTSIIAPTAIGSDARGEKGVSSPFELVVYANRLSTDTIRLPEVSQEISDQLPKNGAPLVMFDSAELKILTQPLMPHIGDQKQLWPGRVLDSVALGSDNHDVIDASRRVLAWEVRAEEIGKKLLEKLKERIRSYRQISETGKQKAKGEEIVHFDLDRGEAYLDADKNRGSIGASSFKQSLLRFV